MTTKSSKTMLSDTVRMSAAASTTTKTQEVRIGTAYDEANDDVQVVTSADTLIHIRDLASLENPAPEFCVVAGQNTGDTEPGRAEYMSDSLEVFARAGWIYGTGTKPKLRTKRVRITGNGTTVMAHIITEASPSQPDDGTHRAYFLETEDGEEAQVDLLDSSDQILASITLHCQSSPPADSKGDAYVVPGRECYVEVDASTTDLDASNVKYVKKEPAGTEPGDNWTGTVQTFLNNVRGRVGGMIT